MAVSILKQVKGTLRPSVLVSWRTLTKKPDIELPKGIGFGNNSQDGSEKPFADKSFNSFVTQGDSQLSHFLPLRSDVTSGYHLFLRFDMPGVSKNSLKFQVDEDENILIITGEDEMKDMAMPLFRFTRLPPIDKRTYVGKLQFIPEMHLVDKLSWALGNGVLSVYIPCAADVGYIASLKDSGK